MRRGQFGSTLAHIGLAVTVIGIAGASTWNVERLAVMKIGDTIDLGGYQLTFKKVYEQAGPNYAEFAGDFDLKSGGALIGTITTSKRKYDAPPQVTTAAGISPRLGGDVYVVLGNEENGAFSIRAYYHPFVRWIWGGALIMFLGGLVSLLDRRLRIGVPQRAARAAFPSAPAPAE
jgi:cytochrome c-type biogenesis protein CcmF